VDYHLAPGGIFENFLGCVRSRKQEQLQADILEGHFSSALCHLGNISYRMGWEVPFNYEAKALGDCPIVRASLKTILDNTLALGVNPAKSTFRLGPKLYFNAAREKFDDNPAANVLLSRPYREPFVVPEKV
jgi:hypothetical protein